MEIQVLGAFLTAIILLLFLILKLRVNAFLSLLIASLAGGLLAGMSGAELLITVQKGMGGTLGFVAVVVGLGAIFGALLEQAGGAQQISNGLITRLGDRNASLAMLVAGFLIAIPVFFDVAFIILVPLVYSLQLSSKKSLLTFALPLLAGLAITHAFIPPTPGPVAVAEIIEVELGWVILAGFVAGIPAAFVGLWYSKIAANKMFIPLPAHHKDNTDHISSPARLSTTLLLIFIPLVLIIGGSIFSTASSTALSQEMVQIITFLGHPFTALIIANLLAWYFLGIKRNVKSKELQKISEKSLMPAGTIILLTGAGGVFKQVLVDTGAGEMLAMSMESIQMPVLLFAFLSASLIRGLQGSATVAMITAAGLTAPLIPETMTMWDKALVVISISSGSTLLSHVNDSGFWLVSRFLGMSVPQTLKSWTVLTTLIGISGFLVAVLLSLF